MVSISEHWAQVKHKASFLPERSSPWTLAYAQGQRDLTLCHRSSYTDRQGTELTASTSSMKHQVTASFLFINAEKKEITAE